MKHKLHLVVLVLCLVFGWIELARGDLDRVLHKFETLPHDAFIHHIHKRDLYVEHPQERQVEYDSFGRHFKLMLQKSTSILSEDFRVVTIGADNVEKVVDIKPAIYHGHLADEPDTSTVNAYWEDEHSLMATITTESDVFSVEPSWRHLPGSSNYSMILYRKSDLDMEADLGNNFCGFIREGPTDSDFTSAPDDKQQSDGKQPGSRKKRASSCTPSKSAPVCKLILVADYRFYRGMGQKNLGKTTSYLIGLIDRINAIYKATSFGNCPDKFGFEIQEIRVYQDPTIDAFNVEQDKWDTGDLLEKFSRDARFKDFCLAHLFTQVAFDNGVLGLAYIGGPRAYSVGGICSPYYFKGGFQLFLNTGWSSAVSRSNRLLLSAEATLVTAHELGHNWGSEHDPDSSECSPTGAAGGKYIMYTYSVSGMDVNNQVFSPCSRRSMGAVLEAKADGCFKQSVGGFCGNMRIEGDEQCDAGPTDTDACCDRTCYLKLGAFCSDGNHICCKNCTYANTGTVCEVGRTGNDPLSTICTSGAKCNGSSPFCPKAVPLPDGTGCLLGSCQTGACKNLCEYNNKTSCVCDTVEDSCKWCCRNASSSECQPFQNRTLPEGMPCLQGYCNADGTCVKSIQTHNPRPWDIIENLTVNKLVQFMRSNIVGTVIVLSLIIWIPVCCIISCVDYKARNEKKKLVNHNDIRNEQFVDKNSESKVQIVRASGVKTRRSMQPGPRGDDQMALLAGYR